MEGKLLETHVEDLVLTGITNLSCKLVLRKCECSIPYIYPYIKCVVWQIEVQTQSGLCRSAYCLAVCAVKLFSPN